MKIKLMLSGLLVSVTVLTGCATTDGAGGQPTAKSVIARYAAAIYGKNGLQRHPSMTMKGTMSIEQFGVEGPIVRYAKAPDSNVTVVEFMDMSLSTGCHKGVCWTQQPGAGTMTLTGDAAAMQLQQADYAQWQHIDRYYTTLEIVPSTDGGDGSIHKIKAVKKNGDTDYYGFSKASGLLTAAVIEGETAQGRMTIGLQFGNYKDFDGLLLPMEIIQSVAQMTLQLTFNEVSFTPLSEDKFAKPE
jgi:predicted small secreted protein